MKKSRARKEKKGSSKSLSKLVQSNKELFQLLEPKWTDYIKTVPTPKQQAFLVLDDVLDAFYGGAVGGGKSEALLMGALQYVDVPHYAAILFRRTYADLSKPGALLDRSKKWLKNTDAHWNDQTKTWTFPSKATLSFGYLDGPDDHYNYDSAEYQYVGMDECSKIRWNQQRYLFSRLRRVEGMDVPIRYRCASNPGGISHEELKTRYVDPKTRDPNVVFLPAWLEDNPHLDKDEYELSLNELDHLTRKRLRKGDWDAVKEGELFKRGWFEIVDVSPRAGKRARFWDLAATKPARGKDPDWTAGPLLNLAPDGVLYIEDMQRVQGTPGYVEALVKQSTELDGMGVTALMEQEGGASGKNTIYTYTKLLKGYSFYGIPSTGPKEEYARVLSSYAEAGNVKLVRAPWNKPFLDELEVFPDPDYHDDQVDSASKCYCWLAGKKSRGGIWGSPRGSR